MVMEKRAENAEQNRAASMTHDVAIRESVPPAARPPPAEHSRHPSQSQDRLSHDVWSSAISRLQAQVSYNTGMLESHRRQLADIEAAVTRLHHEMSNTLGMLNDVRAEVRSRPVPAVPEPARHDSGDLDVFATQLQRLTNRVNEIDGLAMQLDLVKNRMKRMEDGGGSVPPSAHAVRPPPSSSHREAPPYEAGPPPAPSQHVPIHPARAQHPPLPPMRTASVASPEAGRPPNFSGQQPPESQNSHGYRPSTEGRPFSNEPPHHSQPPPGPGYRPGDSLPPPSAISGWRPAEGYAGPPGHSPASAPAPVSSHPGARPHAMDSEMQNHNGGGWAAVNANPAVKRPPEETRSPYESPMSDGSKRPKLAPLMPNMPRSNYGDESYHASQPLVQSHVATSNPSEASMQSGSRAPSDGPHHPSQPGVTPAQHALQHNFRFITSTQQAEAQESWRPDSQREPPPHGHGRGGRGGRGRGGRGRGGRGRGAHQHNHHEHDHAPLHAHAHAHAHIHGHEAPPAPIPPPPQEAGTPEWDKPEWSGSQVSPNGYYNPMHPHSPHVASRGGMVRRPDGHVGGPVERPQDFPATPIQAPSMHDMYGDPNLSGSKKTRTKPIRNSEGILIRKDGRPDMRSVSSANNLRKVHAKKEAERAEMEDDDGTRSATPTSAAAGEDDSEEPADNTQERHRELMSRIFPHGVVEPGAPRATEQYFPPRSEEATSAPMMKTESGRNNGEEISQPPADVVMKETDESQAEEGHTEQDTKGRMETSAPPESGATEEGSGEQQQQHEPVAAA